MLCPMCHGQKLRRIKREGFLHTKLAPIFGYFPWRCSSCGKMQLLRIRQEWKHSEDTDGSPGEALLSSPGQPRG